MKNINMLLSVLSLALVFLSCSKEDTLRGSGNIIAESREVSSFTEVYNPTSVNISIIEGSTQSVAVSADDNVINTIGTSVENGVLKVGLSRGNYIDVTIDIAIVIPDLNRLENTGSGNMTASGFEALAGLAIDNSGSGTTLISGSGNTLTLRNSGSGDYKGFDFIVNNCTVANSGSGTCEINCTGALNGSNSGSGSVFYMGNPSLDIPNTGSGNVVDSN